MSLTLIVNNIPQSTYGSDFELFNELAFKIETEKIKNVKLINNLKFKIEEQEIEIKNENEELEEIYLIFFALRELINADLLNQIEMMHRIREINEQILNLEKVNKRDEKLYILLKKEIDKIQGGYFAKF